MSENYRLIRIPSDAHSEVELLLGQEDVRLRLNELEASDHGRAGRFAEGTCQKRDLLAALAEQDGTGPSPALIALEEARLAIKDAYLALQSGEERLDVIDDLRAAYRSAFGADAPLIDSPDELF